MSINKLPGAGVQHLQLAPLPVPKPTQAAPGGANNGQVAQFQGASFQYGGASTQMRRGPTVRMPLQRARTKKKGISKSASGAHHGGDEDGDFAVSQNNGAGEKAPLSRLQSQFHSGEDGDNESDQEQRDEQRRFDKLFAVSAYRVDSFTKSALQPSLTTKRVVAVPTPLPQMNSLPEVLKFIHGAMQSNPSGKSVNELLRRIAAAVHRGEIKLPRENKIAAARPLLVEIFGEGYQGKEALSESAKSLYTMLPLWLINLSRQRTDIQRIRAAARLSLPGTALITE